MKNNEVKKSNEVYFAKVAEAKKRAEAQAEAMKRDSIVKEYVSLKRKAEAVGKSFEIPNELKTEVDGKEKEFFAMVKEAEALKNEAVVSVCKIVASSVVRKLLQTAGKNNELEEMKRTIYKFVGINDAMGDGNELVNIACVRFYEEVKRAEADGRAFSLFAPFVHEKLTKRTYKSGNFLIEKKEEETSVFREMFRAVRSTIAVNGSINVLDTYKHYYVNYEKSVALVDGREEEVFYKAEAVDTFFASIPNEYREKIAEAKLTALQLLALALLFKGMGINEIAYTLYGRSEDEKKRAEAQDRAKKLIKAVRKKLSVIFETSEVVEKMEQAQEVVKEKKTIYVYDMDGKVVGNFESISSCASALKVNKGSISAVINGKRAKVNGFTFRVFERVEIE